MSEGRSNRLLAAGTIPSEPRGRARQERRVDQGKKTRRLPGSLTDAGLTLAINELPVGARLAADTVYKCWREGKFADDEFVSFLQSISTYSPALQHMVHASMHDSMVSGKPVPGVQLRDNAMGGARYGGFGASAEEHGRGVGVPAAKQLSEESEAAMGINKEWRSRRRREAARRQGAGIQGTQHQQRVGYLCRTFACLRQQLPPQALPSLLDLMMCYSRDTIPPEALGHQVQDLVDAYQVVVPLDYIPQRSYADTTDGGGKRSMAGVQTEASAKGTARGSKKSKAGPVAPLAAVSLDDEALAMGSSMSQSAATSRKAVCPADAICPACQEGTAEDFQMGICPACQQCTAEEHQMVRCKVCRHWFHHVCVMHNPFLTRDDDFECGSENCPSYGRARRPARYKLEDLADTPLGQYLTARSRSAVPNPQDLIIKVVSDKDVYKQLPELRGKAPAHAPAGVGRGYGWCSYRTKCILGFRRFRSTGSQVVFLGMYVHEYDRQCPGPNAGRAMIECLDSTPLYSEERPGERQDILTNIMLAYFEFITAAGFEYAHIRVPPPTDDKGYIFASRSVNVRLRAAMHLAHWFKRLLQTAESKGVIHSFSAGADSGMNDFPASLLEPAQLASDIAFRCATGQSMQQQPGAEASGAEGAMEGLSEVFRAAPLKDRFFVIRLAQTEAGRGAGQSGVNLPRGLDPEKVQRLTWQAMLPSYIAGDRFELVALLQREGLHFHSLAHNNYSTMMLVHHLMEEQRMMVCDGNYHQRYGDRGVSGTGGVALQHLSPMHAHAHHDSFSQHVYQRAQMQRMEVSREMMAGHAAHLGYVEGTAGRGHATGRMPFDVVHGRLSMASPSGHARWDSPPGGEYGQYYPGAATDRSGSSTAAGSSRGAGSTGNMSHSPEQPEGAERSAHDGTPMWAELPGAAQGRAMRVVAGRRGAGAGGDSKNPSRGHPAFVHHGNATSESTHSGSESTPTEQTDQTESDDMLDAIGGTKESSVSSPGAWETTTRETAMVEQGEDMLHHLLGQGMEPGSEAQVFESEVMETCASASAPSLEDVRQAQGQVALTSQEHQDLFSQDQNDWASLY